MVNATCRFFFDIKIREIAENVCQTYGFTYHIASSFMMIVADVHSELSMQKEVSKFFNFDAWQKYLTKKMLKTLPKLWNFLHNLRQGRLTSLTLLLMQYTQRKTEFLRHQIIPSSSVPFKCLCKILSLLSYSSRFLLCWWRKKSGEKTRKEEESTMRESYKSHAVHTIVIDFRLLFLSQFFPRSVEWRN